MVKCSTMVNPKVLVLWSGGKDSLLTTCKLLHEGRDVILFSCNNGSLVAEEYLGHGVRRLQAIYGERVTYAGVYSIVSWVLQLGEWWTNTPLGEIAKDYPNLTWTHVRCLHCQTAMWLSALAYAKAKGVMEVAAGYKAMDEFCTGIQGYWECIRDVARAHGIGVRFPCSEITTDFERDALLCQCGLYPKVFEPKCMQGTPATHLTEEAQSDLVSYTRSHLLPIMGCGVDDMCKVFNNIKLGESTYDLPLMEGMSVSV